jgi:hypothetical protein
MSAHVSPAWKAQDRATVQSGDPSLGRDGAIKMPAERFSNRFNREALAVAWRL